MQKRNDAKDFMLQFKTRIEAFGLSLNMDKIKTINLPTPPRVEVLMKLGKTFG